MRPADRREGESLLESPSHGAKERGSLVFMAKWAIGQRLNGEWSEGTILMPDGSNSSTR